MRTAFLDYETVSNGDLDTTSLLRSAPEIHFYPSTSESQLPERIADAQILLINKIKLTRELLESARELKLIAVAGTGTDGVDLAAAEERGIAVCNVRGYCTASVVQHAWALILSLTQHLRDYARLASDGSWVTLLAPTLLGPGTHFSDHAASVDDHPTEGVILAGEPEAVEKARATHVFSEVAVLSITPSP